MKVKMHKVPADIRKALASIPKAKAQWNDLTPISRRDFVSWIESAKQKETRQRRIVRTCSMLAAGKRRPCCYTIVPMSFYKALATSPKAKARWGSLDPNERRDLTDWIGSATDSSARADRVEKACAMLATGKGR